MSYIITMDTLAFKPFIITKKNWELSSCNDYMYQVNGFVIKENNLTDLKNRLCDMLGYAMDDTYYGEYFNNWRKLGEIVIDERMTNTQRKYKAGVCGIAMGYVDINDVIDEIIFKGSSQIELSSVYDIRQRVFKHFKNCYIKITKE